MRTTKKVHTSIVAPIVSAGRIAVIPHILISSRSVHLKRVANEVIVINSVVFARWIGIHADANIVVHHVVFGNDVVVIRVLVCA